MLLSQKKAITLLEKYKITYPKTQIIKGSGDIKGQVISFPAVLKVDSPSIIHKTELGLVFTRLNSKEEILEKIRYSESVLKEKKIKDYSYIVQEMVKGTELLIGMKRDKSFGPVIMFGIGGIFVELMKDVSMRIAPLTKKDCFEMMSELRGAKLLDGYRNSPKLDKALLAELLMKVSALSLREHNIIEMDFNPAIANEKGFFIVDARIITGEKDA